MINQKLRQLGHVFFVLLCRVFPAGFEIFSSGEGCPKQGSGNFFVIHRASSNWPLRKRSERSSRSSQLVQLKVSLASSSFECSSRKCLFLWRHDKRVQLLVPRRNPLKSESESGGGGLEWSGSCGSLAKIQPGIFNRSDCSQSRLKRLVERLAHLPT